MDSDAELIGWSLAGDGEAFVGVVRRHEAAVGAYLARRVGREMAKDLLGDVWLAAFGSRSAYNRSFPDARPWLFGVARNTLRRHWRALRAEEPLPDIADVEFGWDPWPAVDERVDTDAALHTALMGLRPAEREVLTLVVWEDLSVADAARALGIPSGSAYRHLHQARLALRSAPGMLELLTDLNTVKDAK
ncbi:MAG: RNA polymerase sigma factor [Acidimicrobiales bacterium]